MRFYGAEYNTIERGEAEFNSVVLCSIKPHTRRQNSVWTMHGRVNRPAQT